MWVVAGVLLASHPVMAATAPRITATAAVIMDARTGELLWSRAPDRRLPPASTTKVMTAILALESGKLRERVSASKNACATPPRKISLKPGQQIVLEDLVYAILLNSANDASSVIAENLAGSVPAFGERMTAQARALGARNTQFRNPHGLTAEGHYSSARDQATIFRYALRVPKFRQILNTKTLVIESRNPTQRISLSSHNRLLRHRVPVIGKTGYTRPAKKCFVGSGFHEGKEIIIALLGATDMWGDAQKLLEYGFFLSSGGSPYQEAAVAPPRRVKPGMAKRTKRAPRPTFAVHVGTFDDLARAKRLERALERRGFTAHLDELASGNGRSRRTRYRVEIGPYATRSQAESAMRTMAAEVALSTQIVQR
jgi:D-alanyl-D-alanine carboxypeptidase (penicillin-binding protein 5/6)